MILYSQHAPANKKILLPKSNVTVYDQGCLVNAVLTLGQGENLNALLKEPSAFADGGLLICKVAAELLGMFYVGPTTIAPNGWCIGVTKFYGPKHFLTVNMDTQEMVDPLTYDPVTKQSKILPLKYPIYEFRVFTGVKFATLPPAPVFEAPTLPEVPEWARPQELKAKKAGITTPITQTIGSLPLYQLLAIIDKYQNA